MKKLSVLLICILVTTLSGQRKDDFHLRPRPDDYHSYPVFSQDALTQLAGEKATLDQFTVRLASIDDNVKEVKKTLDNEVMPTIHVFNFLKWIFSIIIGTLIGLGLKDRWENRRRTPKTVATQP